MTLYLTLDEVHAIHARSIEDFGGSTGIRDHGLLDSALAMPSASFGGEDMHATLTEKAAAYAFHIAKNHPFLDGNKRTALAAALAFLHINGVHIEATDEEYVALGLGLAAGTVTKSEAAVFFASHSAPRAETAD
jgi:death-on-curing protein